MSSIADFASNISSATERVVRSWHHNDLLNREKFSEISYLLSRHAVAKGLLEIFAEIELPPQQVMRVYKP